MTTKEQEKKALEQIKKIVEGLGENSYIATAFEGCFEDAEENIENDFAFSMNGRWQDAEQKIETLKAKIEELEKTCNTLKQQNNEYAKNLQETTEFADRMFNKAAIAEQEVINERKEVNINGELKPFKEVRFINHNGFRFVNVVEESGWTNSYKIDELEELTIK